MANAATHARTRGPTRCGCHACACAARTPTRLPRLPRRHWTVINHVVLWVSIVFILPFLWLYGLTWEVGGAGGGLPGLVVPWWWPCGGQHRGELKPRADCLRPRTRTNLRTPMRARRSRKSVARRT